MLQPGLHLVETYLLGLKVIHVEHPVQLNNPMNVSILRYVLFLVNLLPRRHRKVLEGFLLNIVNTCHKFYVVGQAVLDLFVSTYDWLLNILGVKFLGRCSIIWIACRESFGRLH